MADKSSVDRIYHDLKGMASSFAIKPDEKLNEMAMAERLGASRTPLREALNRLVSEGFFTFEKGRGFFCRSLTAGEILDLYQAREAVESKLVELACERASKEELLDLQAFLKGCEAHYNETTSAEELVELDEQFHMGIAKISRNKELMRILDNLNARMRYVRTFDLEKRRVVTPQNHMDIMQAMLARNPAVAVNKMRSHVMHSSEEATEAVRAAYARIYVPNELVNGSLS